MPHLFLTLTLAFVCTTAFALPAPASAFFGSIVQCGQPCANGQGIVPCTTCDIVALIQNIIRFFIFAATAIAVLLFVYAGVLMVTAMGDMGKLATARSIFSNVLIGFIITLTAWLVIDTIMKVFYNQSTIGQPWNQIICPSNNPSTACETIAPPAASELTENQNEIAQLRQMQVVEICDPAQAAMGGGTSCTRVSMSMAECQNAAASTGQTCQYNTVPAPPMQGMSQTAAGGTCANCVMMPSEVPMVQGRACQGQSAQGGCQIDAETASRLRALAGAGAGRWEVTEAWPPTVVHQNACHRTGTCVDVGFRDPQTPTNLNRFIDAAGQNGLRAVWEVPTEAQRQELIRGGMDPGRVQTVPGVRPHFSVYQRP